MSIWLLAVRSYALCTACYVPVQHQAVHAANALGYHNTSRGQSVSPLRIGKPRLSRASAVFPSWWSLAGNKVSATACGQAPELMHRLRGADALGPKGSSFLWKVLGCLGRNSESHGSPPGSQKLQRIYNKRHYTFVLWRDYSNILSFDFPISAMGAKILTLQGWWES